MEDLKALTVLVYDFGNNVSWAQRLAREFGHVFYCNPVKSSYPSSNEAIVGEGIDEIEVIDNLWDYVDMADLFVFPDLYSADIQLQLERMGKRVWGARKGDELELQRWETKQLFKKLGLPVNGTEKIISLPKLREHLKANDDRYVKISKYRGDFESFHSADYRTIEPVLDNIEQILGAKKYLQEFIVEEGVEAVCEAGYDGYCVDGKYPDKCMTGYEIKDAGYGCAVVNYADLSPLITDYNSKIAPTLEMERFRSQMSTEIRITKDKKPYVIDLTMRNPEPPGMLQQEMISNWGQIMWAGSVGEMVQPEFEAKYGLQIVIQSDWAVKHWQAIYFPDEIARWVKLKNHCIIKGSNYVVPQDLDMPQIGAVVSMGDSIDDCVKKVEEYISQIEGYGLSMNTSSIMEKLNEQIASGEEVGIKFS